MGKMTQEQIRFMEDQVKTIVEKWSDEQKAMAYALLYADGMSLSKAHKIKVKAGIIN